MSYRVLLNWEIKNVEKIDKKCKHLSWRDFTEEELKKYGFTESSKQKKGINVPKKEKITSKAK